MCSLANVGAGHVLGGAAGCVAAELLAATSIGARAGRQRLPSPC